jgi:2-dehydro-3-deoxyphosphogluconate aldolase/(4S)-4-hydroxy-2-oxoglutarate aldolase
MDLISQLKKSRIVPVIKLTDVKDAVSLCGALAGGGLKVAEITFRTDAAEESIKRVSKSLPDIFARSGHGAHC